MALNTNAKGSSNWDFAGAPASKPAAAVPDGAAVMGGVFVGDLAIRDGVLTFHDGESGKLTTVTIADLALNARDPQSAVSMRFRGNADDIAVALEGDLGS